MQDKLFTLGATQMTLDVLGSSQFPTKITPRPGQVFSALRFIAGGTVYIMPETASEASSGTGYALGTEPFYINGPASFYLGAGSTQSIVHICYGYTAGGATLS